jgi:hypothetical protein
MWFKLLTKGLREFGYEHSPTDQCVIRKVKGERIFLLLKYVDDILAIVDDKERMDLRNILLVCLVRFSCTLPPVRSEEVS